MHKLILWRRVADAGVEEAEDAEEAEAAEEAEDVQ